MDIFIIKERNYFIIIILSFSKIKFEPMDKFKVKVIIGFKHDFYFLDSNLSKSYLKA